MRKILEMACDLSRRWDRNNYSVVCRVACPDNLSDKLLALMPEVMKVEQETVKADIEVRRAIDGLCS